MLTGTLFALAAGLMWGLVFVVPVLLPEYPAALLACGRYLAFGLIALPLAWLGRAGLRELTRADWAEALRLSLVGNLLYYLLLAAAIQRAGTPPVSMVIGTLPVVIAVCANRRNAARDGLLPWRRLAGPLGLMALGLGLVNHEELAALRADPGRQSAADHALGLALAVGALACWTWYPLRNADWLRAHSERSPRAWATAQGLATLPLAAIGLAGLWALQVTDALPSLHALSLPLGPSPGRFVALMLVVGLCASWLGTLCWNEASQRLPTALAGQLIVFETLSALAYAFVLRSEPPGPASALGIALLVAGVWLALRIQPVAQAALAEHQADAGH